MSVPKRSVLKKRVYFTVSLTLLPFCIFAKEEGSITCFIQAYKGSIQKIIKDQKKNTIYFVIHNQKMVWNDHVIRNFNEKLLSPDIQDTISIPYPAFRSIQIHPRYNEDPGRFRNQSLLRSVYGDNEQSVKNNLVQVRWMPKTLSAPTYLLFNKNNGAAAALQKISDELDHLSPELKKYVTLTAGTFQWRPIAGTQTYSAHAYGVAIDINTQYSNYWRWDNKKNLDSKHLIYHNRIPQKIVNIFEKNGFIWGGRWYHYDTMHFEYRPEFFCKRVNRVIYYSFNS